jgi:hypothetical protein
MEELSKQTLKKFIVLLLDFSGCWVLCVLSNGMIRVQLI